MANDLSTLRTIQVRRRQQLEEALASEHAQPSPDKATIAALQEQICTLGRVILDIDYLQLSRAFASVPVAA